MTAITLLTSLAYVLPIALLALLLTGAQRRHGWIIAAVLAALPVFYIAQYQLVQALRGWPVDAPVPETFELLAFNVTEPQSDQSAAGAIHLWIREAPDQRPRAHALPYDRALHEALDDAGRRLATGDAQYGRRDSAAESAVPGGGAGRPGGIRFDDRPPTRLPRKGAAGR